MCSATTWQFTQVEDDRWYVIMCVDLRKNNG
jgi:hypothetical protein